MKHISIGLLLACLCTPALAEELRYVGYAYSAESGDLVYEEHHEERVAEDGNIVLETVYRDPEGEVLARRTVQFQEPATAPEFRLVDQRFDYEEGAEARDGGYRIYMREGNTLEESMIRPEELPLVIDAGFDRLIVEHWGQLLDGDTVRFEFVSTARQSKIDFRLKLTERFKTPDGPASSFELTLSNPFLRLFVDPIRVTYLDSSQALYGYRGISNIRSSEGDNYVVNINFPVDERRGEQDRQLAKLTDE